MHRNKSIVSPSSLNTLVVMFCDFLREWNITLLQRFVYKTGNSSSSRRLSSLKNENKIFCWFHKF